MWEGLGVKGLGVCKSYRQSQQFFILIHYFYSHFILSLTKTATSSDFSKCSQKPKMTQVIIMLYHARISD